MENQKKKRLGEDLDIIFAKALAEGVFPGGVVGLSYCDIHGATKEYYRGYGVTDTWLRKYPVHSETIYDLASLTKVLVTGLLVLKFCSDGRLRLEDRLGDILEDPMPSDKAVIRIEQLMSHCSGLAAHRTYYPALIGLQKDKRRDYVVSKILTEPLEYKPGSRHLYSDLGYILLGAVLERISGLDLTECWRKEIAGPMELGKSLFIPLNEKLSVQCCGVTEVCPWTNKLLCGSVHDDNCRLMGGLAGHAGLFGTAKGVIKVCRYLLDIYNGKTESLLFSRDLLREAVVRRKGATWACGFDTPTTIGSSSGKYFSKASVGHLGFTGTSFWIDLDEQVVVVLLTNRVCPTRRNEKIKRFRPQLHNIIRKKLV